MKSAKQNERGFISFSVILGLAIVVVTVFSSVKLLPPYIANYQFQDFIDNTARSATYSPISEADLKKEILNRARQLGIPLQDKQVTLHKVRGGTVTIQTAYDVPVDLIARQVVLHFEPTAGNTNIVSR